MEEAMYVLGGGGTWDIPVPSSQLCYRPKTALKKLSLKRKKLLP